MQSKNYSLGSKPFVKPLEQISSPFQKCLSPGRPQQQILPSPMSQKIQTLPNQQVFMAPPPMVRSASSTSLQSPGLQQQQLPIYQQQQQQPILSPTSNNRRQISFPPSPAGIQRTTSCSPPSNRRVVATNVQPPMMQQQQQNMMFSKVQGLPPMANASKIISQPPPQPTQLQALPSNTSMQNSGSQRYFAFPPQNIQPAQQISFQQVPQPQVTYVQPPMSPQVVTAIDPAKERRINELELQNKSLLEIISKLESENSNQGQFNNISKDLTLLQEQLSYYQSELSSKDEQLQQWKSQCESLSSSQSKYSAQIQELNSALSNSKLTIQNLSSQLESLSSNQTSTYELEKLQSRIKQYESQVAKQNEDLIYLRNYQAKNDNSEELRLLRSQKDQLQDSYRRIEQNYKVEIEAYEKEIKRLKDQHQQEISFIKKTSSTQENRETIKRSTATKHYKPKQQLASSVYSSSYQNDYTEQSPSLRGTSNLKHSQFQHGSYKSYDNTAESDEKRKVVRTYVVKSGSSEVEGGSDSLRQSSISRSRLDRSSYNTTVRAAN